jgi:hypothetical protein
LEREFASVFTADDLIKLGQHDIALKLSIDGETSKPFSARSLEPLPIVGLKDRIIKYSREHYTHHKKYVEERVFVDLGLEPQESRAEPQAELDKSDKEVGKEVKVEVSELVKEEVKESRGVGQEFIEVKVMENGEKKELCPDEEVVF